MRTPSQASLDTDPNDIVFSVFLHADCAKVHIHADMKHKAGGPIYVSFKVGGLTYIFFKAGGLTSIAIIAH